MADDRGAAMKEKLAQLNASYSRSQKLAAAGAVAVVVVGVLVMTRFVGKATFAPAFTQVESSDASAITEELTKEGVPYQLADGGATIMVPSTKVDDVRLKVAGAGLPSNSKVGYGVLDGQSMTSSEFQQHVGFQRAMEGELATTIESLDVVDSATVHLALPDDSAFALDEQKATASVLVRIKPGRTMGDQQVQAVVNLVASGIKGLAPEDVTVADAEGNVLAAPGQGITGTGGGGTRQKETEQFEQSVARSIQDLLVPIAGPNAARVTVAADLDYDQTNRSRESFEQPTPSTPGGPPIALEESTKNETFTGGSPGTSGVLGPDTPATATGDGASNYNLDEGDVRYAVNRVVETTNTAPGAIKRLSVAVAVDQSKVPAGSLNELTDLVSAAAGIQSSRGDTLALTRIEFDRSAAEQARKELAAADKAEAQAASQERMQTMALAGFLLVVMVVAFVLWRRAASRRRRRAELLAELQREAGMLPAPLVGATGDLGGMPAMAAGMVRDADAADEIDLTGVPAAAAAIGAAGTAVLERPVVSLAELPMGELSEEDEQRIRRQAQISQLVDAQPDEVAAMMRGWLGDRRGGRR